MLNCLRDTACKYFLAFNGALFYSLRICYFVYLYSNNFILIHFDLKMTLNERRNVVAFESFLTVRVFNRDGFNFCPIAMFYS